MQILIFFFYILDVHVPWRCSVRWLYIRVRTRNCCWYRSDRYRRFEDKMDNENDSLWAYIHIRTRYTRWRGGKIIIIAKEHITRGEAGRAKCLTQARMQITRTTRRGRKCIQPKRGRSFFAFFLPYIKNKTQHLYCVFVYAQSDTLTWEYRISYLEHANKIVQQKKKIWFLHFTLNSY